MKKFFDNDTLEHKSRPPLRWVANLFGSISSHCIMNVAWLDEDQNYNWKYNLYSKIYSITFPVYLKYGSFYYMGLDMDGKAWDDYDENGIPYWERTGTIDPFYDVWDFEDEETGDAFRVIL
jgi:hypothetical protein